MASKSELKYLRSLKSKKNRQQEGTFVVEGHKGLIELLNSSLLIETIWAKEEWLIENEESIAHLLSSKVKIVTNKDLDQLTQQKNPNQVLATAHIPEHNFDPYIAQNQLVLVLDAIRDPGNLGTIIRTADWFGIKAVICSNDCVDAYNSKVVQSSMGSLFRTPIHYVDLEVLLKETSINKPNFPILGASLEGESFRELPKPNEGFLIIGNESNGIRPSLLPYINQAVHIPKLGHAESLNASVAAAILTAWACL